MSVSRDELIRALDESDVQTLAILTQAVQDAKRNLLEGTTSARLDALKKAEAMVKAFLREREGSAAEVFRTRADVLRHLEAEGWKVSKSKLYRDVDDKLLQPEADGCFSLRAVEAYAESYLQYGGATEDDKGDEREAREVRLERERLKARAAELDIELKEIRVNQEKGRLIEVDVHNQHMGAAAAILRDSQVTFFETRTKEIIYRCGGDPSREAETKNWLLEVSLDWLHGFSRKVAHKVPKAQEAEEAEKAGADE